MQFSKKSFGKETVSLSESVLGKNIKRVHLPLKASYIGFLIKLIINKLLVICKRMQGVLGAHVVLRT